LGTMHSYDGGSTWTSPAQLVDATAGGNPGYTFGDIKLTANAANGSIALLYSLVSGTTPAGIHVMEF
jgi:hypothetical protein